MRTCLSVDASDYISYLEILFKSSSNVKLSGALLVYSKNVTRQGTAKKSRAHYHLFPLQVTKNDEMRSLGISSSCLQDFKADL